MDEYDQIALVCAVVVVVLAASAPPRIWRRNWIANRPRYGVYHSLLSELLEEDKSTFGNFVRMDKPTFDLLPVSKPPQTRLCLIVHNESCDLFVSPHYFG